MRNAEPTRTGAKCSEYALQGPQAPLRRKAIGKWRAPSWRGCPRTFVRTNSSLIGNPKDPEGLRVIAELDEAGCARDVVIPRATMLELNIERDEFRGGWNYDILPALLLRSDE
jgi:hypothetical protein